MSPERPQALDPYASLPQVPAFELRSDTFTDGARVPDETTNTPLGTNLSPHLAWSGFPEETRSFAVTCFDLEGPSGWWHWTLLDVPATITELAAGAGALGSDLLPSTVVTLRGDDGIAGYVGAAPTPSDQVHRYVYAVHALDLPEMGLEPDTMPGAANSALVPHTIARALLVGTYQR
ncbi:MAG: YbhB/YbcL family Raf kinase inhibitor-like protein [Micrococcales bacterium]|nr:YbhB/YbcL family Raf kinase inhibitor-like protein [Micrococcales bacterium]